MFLPELRDYVNKYCKKSYNFVWILNLDVQTRYESVWKIRSGSNQKTLIWIRNPGLRTYLLQVGETRSMKVNLPSPCRQEYYIARKSLLLLLAGLRPPFQIFYLNTQGSVLLYLLEPRQAVFSSLIYELSFMLRRIFIIENLIKVMKLSFISRSGFKLIFEPR